MKQNILAFAAFLSFQILAAQTYVQFDRNCMSQLEYRYSYPNLKGDNPVWAYSVKPNFQEHFIFMTEGAGHYSPERPEGTVTCRSLDLDDAFIARVNQGTEQMAIVFQRQSGGYWLMPVESATLVARKGSKYWVRTYQSSFQFDTLRMVNEQNLAVSGSPTAAYFSGVKLNNCLMEYSFHCEPVKSGQIRSDFQFIPDIGIVNDRTGKSASAAMENELQLVKVKGLTLDDYITEACPEGSGKIAISKFQKPANYGDDSFEPDKEISSIMQNEQKGQTPAVYSTDADGNPCAEEWEPGTHIVQKKENLRAIARTYNVREQDLIKWNKIQNPDRIEICQKIWLKQPPANAISRGMNKGTKPQVYDTQPETGKTVKIQGNKPSQKGIVKDPVQNSPKRKAYDPNSAVEYSDGPAESNDYQYFEPEKTGIGTRPKIHTVHRGEYLYKIAKMYRCPEECIRIANAMPLEGDEPLTIGQELIIPECTCTVDGKTLKRPSTNATKPTVKKQNPATDRQGYNQGKKPRPNLLDDSDESVPVEYNYDEDRVYKDNDRYEETSLYEEDAASGKNTKVQLSKEHAVKQGETLRSIAAKYKVDATKLAKLNGLRPNEEPRPGTTFLIPIEEAEKEDNKPTTRKPSSKKDEGYNPYNYEAIEYDNDMSPASNSSPKSTTSKKLIPRSGGSGTPESKRPNSGSSVKPRPSGGLPPSTMNDTETDVDRRVTTGVAASKSYGKQPYDPKQKPRSSILDEDPSERRSPRESDSKPRYVEDDRDEIEVKGVAKPKSFKPVAGTSPTDLISTRHIVKKGETIQSIANKYHVSASEISLINNIGIDDSLIPGKTISIPIDDNK